MRIPGRSDGEGRRELNPARGEIDELADRVGELLVRAVGVSWYEEEGNAADRAVAALCRLRRVAAGGHGAAEGGDAVVRAALGRVDPEALVWIASRTVSFMDEHGFPESVAD